MSPSYERPAPTGRALRLHLNEHTGGCSPAALARVRALDAAALARYPDYDEAVEACARRLGVRPEQLVLTNGLDEGILAVTVAACRRRPDAEAIVIEPAFDMYAAAADAVGAFIVSVPFDAGFRFPLERVLAAIGPRTRLVFLNDPHNPTGRRIPRGAVEAVAGAARDALVLLDEAYADFAGETFIDRALAAWPNVVVGRTFAKAYGLAGIRAGALVGQEAALEPIRRAVPPYSVNAAAVAALPAALADEAHVEAYCREVEVSKQLLYAACRRLGLDYWESAANFVLVRIGDRAPAVVEALARRGVVVRDRSRDTGCAGCIRITTGRVADTRVALAALEEVLCASV
ncbi:MAG TPA: histidinol-phosphate transaminase [Vicinamibacterales bacterium]|nr:histidinol-phosphate transaminase [Vicinamibacterales bacterium]